MCINNSQRGISLIELIVFIVIVSISLTSLLMVLDINTKGSVDPLLRKQALAIAESELEEIEAKDFSTVLTYNGFTNTVDSYSVSVTVNNTMAWGSIPVGKTAEITVTATDPNSQTIQLVGYRVDY